MWNEQQLHHLHSFHCSMCDTKANIVLVRAGQEMEHVFNLHRVSETYLFALYNGVHLIFV